MLSAHAVSWQRAGQDVLETLDCHVSPGECLALLGPNGAGKSSLLALLAGDERPSHGEVCLEGVALQHIAPRALAQRRAVLTQQQGDAAGLSVREVVAIGLAAHGLSETAPVLAEALTLAHALPFATRRYDTLSGGERQRVQLARVLAQVLAAPTSHARYLLLDEPTTALDLAQQQHILTTCSQLSRRHPLGVIIILHDLNLALRYADRILVLKQGRVVAHGNPAQTLTTACIAQVWGVETSSIPDPNNSGKSLIFIK